MTEVRKNPAQTNDSAINRTFPIKFPQAWISSHRSSLLTLLSGQNTIDEVPRCKFFNASTAHFGSLSFTLPKKAVPCRAVPCQLTFVKWVSTARLGTARHGKTRVYTDETSGAVSCRAVLTRFFWLADYRHHDPVIECTVLADCVAVHSSSFSTTTGLSSDISFTSLNWLLEKLGWCR